MPEQRKFCGAERKPLGIAPGHQERLKTWSYIPIGSAAKTNP